MLAPLPESHITHSLSTDRPAAGFDRFALRPELLRAVHEAGFHEPRPIQLEALPPALEGRDVLGLAQTGTGKTAAFVLPILQRLLSGQRSGPRALVVTPTRELAAQILTEFERLARFTPLAATAVYGGVPIPKQERALARRPEIVVACPGRLLDLLDRRALRLDRVEVLVLDEADHMFDMGFLPDVRRVIAKLPAERQNLLFSATMPREIRRLADGILQRPALVELAHSRPAETIEHALVPVAETHKLSALERLLADPTFRSAIVFARTKRRASRLAEQLGRKGHRAVALQGNMSQSQRDRAMRGFREGHYRILVATDIAARGLDVAGVSHVINFDLPNTPDAYTHRVGRTGRSGSAGVALTLVTSGDAEAVRAIEQRLGAAIPRKRLDGFEPVRDAGAKGETLLRRARPERKLERKFERKLERTRTERNEPVSAWPRPPQRPPQHPATPPVPFGHGIVQSYVGAAPAKSARADALAPVKLRTGKRGSAKARQTTRRRSARRPA